MKKIISGLLFLGAVLMNCSTAGARPHEDWTRYVEPRIGTAHCRWFHFAPGAMPFGLAKPAFHQRKSRQRVGMGGHRI